MRAALSAPAQAHLAFAIDADMTTVFSWNTKLLFVYLAAEYETPLNELNQVREVCQARVAPALSAARRFHYSTASSSRRRTRTSLFHSCETSTSCWTRCAAS